MGEEIDSLIKSKEAELLPFYSRMGEIKNQFIKETILFAAEWYRKTAKDYVAKYSQVTLGLSSETIVEMKVRVDDLAKNAEKIVKDELDIPALWWHEEPHLLDSIDRYKQVADRYSEVLDHALRRALGYLGVILEEFGYNVVASGDSASYKEFWFEHLPESRQIVPFYPHILKWSEEMQQEIREYDSQYVLARELYIDLHKLKEEKKRQQALTRWDSK